MQLREEVHKLKAMLHSDTPIPTTYLQNPVNRDGKADAGDSVNHVGAGLENGRSLKCWTC